MTNVWYVKDIQANCDGSLYLPILHLPRVELHCKLQEKLHGVTGPLDALELRYYLQKDSVTFYQQLPAYSLLIYFMFVEIT